MSSLNERRQRLAERLSRHGQQHLLAFWEELNAEQRELLLDDIEQLDFDRIEPLVEPMVRNRPAFSAPQTLLPPDAYPADPGPDRAALYASARERGGEAVRAGRVAAFTVAGGQGTRLGYDGPKGGFAITPVRNAPLFQVFAEYLRGTERRYGALPRWYVMTSPQNHAATLEIFEAHAYFGLPRDGVRFFPQGQMPAFLPDGRIALAAKHRIALGPDGHGGSLSALAQSGALADMRARGIETISYFQVDNPLVHVIDPLFIGLHLETGSEMSSKAVTKAHDLERVGNFCMADGKLTVIEYSDMSEELALAKNADGSRRFDAGSIAIHLLSRSFVERLTGGGAADQLPWHRADKKVAVIDDAGNVTAPDRPNVVKLEMFVFDAIPLAANPLVLYTKRDEEFSPVKNATGDDSPATARRDMIRRAARWLESAGVTVPRTAQGEPDCTLEISPIFALDAADLRARLAEPPRIAPGGTLVL